MQSKRGIGQNIALKQQVPPDRVQHTQTVKLFHAPPFICMQAQLASDCNKFASLKQSCCRQTKIMHMVCPKNKKEHTHWNPGVWDCSGRE